jgi:hypothetical protein
MREINITKDASITLNRQTGLFNVWDCNREKVLYSSTNILDADAYQVEYQERINKQQPNKYAVKQYKQGDAIEVLLFNDGGYEGLLEVSFPVRVNAYFDCAISIRVSSSELKRVGADREVFSGAFYVPFIGAEYTAIL